MTRPVTDFTVPVEKNWDAAGSISYRRVQPILFEIGFRMLFEVNMKGSYEDARFSFDDRVELTSSYRSCEWSTGIRRCTVV